jgi:ribose 1,5-bisphosphokinase PhnN
MRTRLPFSDRRRRVDDESITRSKTAANENHAVVFVAEFNSRRAAWCESTIAAGSMTQTVARLPSLHEKRGLGAKT